MKLLFYDFFSNPYLNTGITPKGYSPVELLISQTNKYFLQSHLESRPIVQFKDLFQGVEFTPQQKFAAISPPNTSSI
ncbi:hypothetical protein [Nostoc sphaeroides]|uniref:hypothetical protein n=1 Tax=Nostoc sphaeroides TaxID=446679 RepID=UPI002B3FFFC8|nr:hypothetical protein [Nostoc sphaeroides]